jgi:hypothetical protein
LTALYEILDVIRIIEVALPECSGLAEIVYRYASGVEMSVADRLALIAMTEDIRRWGDRRGST